MPAAWFLAPYQRLPNRPDGTVARGCVFGVRHAAAVNAAGGRFAAAEVLGDHDLIKVTAPAATLQAIADDPDLTWIPAGPLAEPLTVLDADAKQTILAKVAGLGYEPEEIDASFGGDLGTHTLGALLRFIAQRAHEPRYDEQRDAIVLDGPEWTPIAPELLDRAVS